MTPERLRLPPSFRARIAKSTIKLVALVLVAHGAQGSGVAWPSVPTIASKACISERQARVAMRALEALRIVERAPDAALAHKRERAKKGAAPSEREGGRYTPTFYRVVVGRVPLAKGGRDAPQVQRVRDAYARGLEARHGTRHVPLARIDAWKSAIAPIEGVAKLYGESFDRAADRVLAAYFARDDDRLVAACHPPAWLPQHLAAIDSTLRKLHARELKRASERRAAAVGGGGGAPLSAAEVAAFSRSVGSAIGSPSPRST